MVVHLKANALESIGKTLGDYGPKVMLKKKGKKGVGVKFEPYQLPL